jgi:hypothetical protein
MLKASRAFLLGITALLASSGATAHAQDPYGLGFAYLFGYGATNTPRISSFVPAPPYFALHPPVYYGQRYTRPYGDSPFASWPQLQPAAGYHAHPAAPHAQIVVNPYAPAICPDCPAEVPAEVPADAPSDSPVIQNSRPAMPLVIDNPYYRAAETEGLIAAADAASGAGDK